MAGKRPGADRPYEPVKRAGPVEAELSPEDKAWLDQQREERRFIVEHGHLPGEGTQARTGKAFDRAT